MTRLDEILPETAAPIASVDEPVRAKTSTERVRAFRERQGKLGNHASGMVLSARAQLAISIIRQVLARSSKVGAIETALVHEARRLLPDDVRIDHMIEVGKLPADMGAAWREELLAVEAEEAAEAAAAAAGTDVKRPKKSSRDLRVRIGNKPGVRIDGSGGNP